MTKQKRGFWLFIFSLIPGAGELYMGFRKQGISIMGCFWLIIAVAAGLNFGWLLMLLPILWFYSFFNVHNLKSLSEEEFYSLEDDYIMNLDQVFANSGNLVYRYRVLVAVGLIVAGLAILWNSFWNLIQTLLPEWMWQFGWQIGNLFPRLILAVIIIKIGVYLIRGKKKELEMNEEA